MLAFIVALVCVSSAYSATECGSDGCCTGCSTGCSNSGCWIEDGFTFSYARVNDDYVDIYATVETDTWVGVGISEDNMMPDTDAVVGARDGDMYFLDDRYNVARPPGNQPFDAQQDISMKMVTEENGYTSIQFRRPLNSTDVTYDIDLLECRYVLWAYGGPVTSYGANGMNGVFGGHSDKGVFTKKICLCDAASDNDADLIANKDCDSGAATVIISLASLMVMVVIAMFFSF